MEIDRNLISIETDDCHIWSELENHLAHLHFRWLKKKNCLKNQCWYCCELIAGCDWLPKAAFSLCPVWILLLSWWSCCPSVLTTLQILCSCAHVSSPQMWKLWLSFAFYSSQKCHTHLSPLEICGFLHLCTWIIFPTVCFFSWGLHLMLGKHLLPGWVPCMNQLLLGQGLWFQSQNWFGMCWEESSREETWIINRQGTLRAVLCSEKRMGMMGGEGELKKSEMGGHWVQRDQAGNAFSLGRLVVLGCCSILYKGR